jgi:hypothetical protein
MLKRRVFIALNPPDFISLLYRLATFDLRS